MEDDFTNEVSELGGVPEEHRAQRKARIFCPARNVLQSGWGKTDGWKIELDNQERWENPNIGWCSRSVFYFNFFSIENTSYI